MASLNLWLIAILRMPEAAIGRKQVFDLDPVDGRTSEIAVLEGRSGEVAVGEIGHQKGASRNRTAIQLNMVKGGTWHLDVGKNGLLQLGLRCFKGGACVLNAVHVVRILDDSAPAIPSVAQKVHA